MKIRIECENIVEIFAQKPCVFTHTAAHIHSCARFIDKWLRDIEGEFAMMRGRVSGAVWSENIVFLKPLGSIRIIRKNRWRNGKGHKSPIWTCRRSSSSYH